MSIGAANLFTRNIWRACVNPRITDAQASHLANNISLMVKCGAPLAAMIRRTSQPDGAQAADYADALAK